MNKLYLFKTCSGMGVAADTMVQHDQEPVAEVQTHLLLKNESVYNMLLEAACQVSFLWSSWSQKCNQNTYQWDPFGCNFFHILFYLYRVLSQL